MSFYSKSLNYREILINFKFRSTNEMNNLTEKDQRRDTEVCIAEFIYIIKGFYRIMMRYS